MFAESSPLIDFIETPSNRCQPADLAKGIRLLSAELKRNPDAVLNILIDKDRYTPASLLLSDLAVKITKQNENPLPDCVTSLQSLYEKCLPRLVKTCVTTVFDLDRCIEAMPGFKAEILKRVVADEKQMLTMLSSLEKHTPERQLEVVVGKYPEVREQFTTCFQESNNPVRLGV